MTHDPPLQNITVMSTVWSAYIVPARCQSQAWHCDQKGVTGSVAGLFLTQGKACQG